MGKLPVKPEESSSEEEEEPEPEPIKKKLSKADLKPAVQIKIAAAPEPAIGRRKKKPDDEEPKESLFDDLPKAKPKVNDEFKEKEKKPKEEEEEPKPEPKKKLSRSDLKPAVQIKVAAAPEPAIGRRKKKPVDDEPKESLFDDLPKAKPKVKDEFAEKDKKPKEEEKIVITPKDLPEKEEEKPKEKEKVRDEFAEREKKPKEEEKIIITPAKLPVKPESESE